LLKFVARPFLVLVVFAVALQAVSRVLAFGVDGEAANLARRLLREVRRADALAQRVKEVAEAESIRGTATEDFIAGRLTLTQAMEQYREAEKIIAEDHQGLVPRYQKVRTREELCRQICAWVQTFLLTGNYTSQEANSVHQRLENELKELYPTEDIDPYLNPPTPKRFEVEMR
jgi:hypothetical protein